MEQKNTWETYDEKQLGEVDAFAREYMDFLDRGKTERECIDQIVNTLDEAGYQELEALVKDGKKLKAGDKVYSVWMNKSIVMFQIGKEKMEDGINILGAHIDSPRLDVKQNPLYEDRKRFRLSGHPLLRRCEKVPVGDNSPFHSWRGGEEGRQHRGDQRGRERG